jgi:hypothetical protein
MDESLFWVAGSLVTATAIYFRFAEEFSSNPPPAPHQWAERRATLDTYGEASTTETEVRRLCASEAFKRWQSAEGDRLETRQRKGVLSGWFWRLNLILVVLVAAALLPLRHGLSIADIVKAQNYAPAAIGSLVLLGLSFLGSSPRFDLVTVGAFVASMWFLEPRLESGFGVLFVAVALKVSEFWPLGVVQSLLHLE